MNRFIATIVFALLLAACIKSPELKLVGTWKCEGVKTTEMATGKVTPAPVAFYTFSATQIKIIIPARNGQKPREINRTYRIAAESSDFITVEVNSDDPSVSHQKATFNLLSKDKMWISIPDGKCYMTRQESSKSAEQDAAANP